MNATRVLSLSSGAGAVLADSLALAVLGVYGSSHAVVAAVLHGIAVLLVGWMPRSLKSVQRSAVELKIARVITLAVPWIGPVSALSMRTRSARTRRRMERQLEHFYSQFLDHPGTVRSRSPFCGTFDEDVDRLSDAQSFATVLRYGSADHKRGVLRRLGEHDGRQAMALLRHCLVGGDAEIALFAYGQLDQTDRALTESIIEHRKALATRPNDPNARANLADAHRRLARSGALDDAMARWHEQEALRIGATAGAPAHANDDGDGVTEDGPQAMLIARAERAFYERDFDAVAGLANRLRDLGAQRPAWMEAIRFRVEGVRV